MKSENNNWYKIFQALSLDVVTGSTIFSLAICRYYQLHIPCTILISLSVSIWLFYTTDHLFDSFKISGRASTYRHQFHQKYQKPILWAVLFFFIADIINAYFLPAIIFRAGLILGLLIFIYLLLLQKTSLWAKEICVATFYTFGIFTGPVCLSYKTLHAFQWLLVPQVFLLVFSNLLIFSWFDLLRDLKDGHASMVIHFGKSFSEKIIGYTLAGGFILSSLIIILKPTEPNFIMQAIILLMFSFLTLLFKREALFRNNDLYRVIGDGVFFLPVIFLLYAGLRQF